MSEMVERVARAIVASYGTPTPYKYDDLPEFSREAARKCARAAIEAMREPAEAMRVEGDTMYSQGVREIWQAMIDEALRD